MGQTTKSMSRAAKALALAGFAALFLTACDDEDAATKAAAKADASGARAALSLTLDDFRYVFENDRNTFYHNRNYIEQGGVGVTLTRGKVCVEDGKICVESAVQYRIEPDATLTQPDHKVATKLDKDRITIEYWGSADNGEPVHVRKVLRTEDKTATVQ